ncbi:hypothetical protein QVD17_24970 [Tagetes erecta]|uniref:BHLH domain-containing protein n=1 Tax=Tagetes erecta TaxID=13708 RepID=A0AAD8KFN7_TARER|nr:hypothetical protein QVD17_24970 [Tagetes erecta]
MSSCQIVMEVAEAWFSDLENEGQEFLTCDEMKDLYDTVDNISVDSYSSESYTENMKLIDQSFSTDQQPEIKPPCFQEKRSQTSEPLISTLLPSSNTFTISFGNINSKNKNDILGLEAANNAAKVPTTGRNLVQVQDHVMAERKRREKLNQNLISLSSLLPNLKKTDKASVLEDASNYIKELQDRVTELEGLTNTKKKQDVQECFISSKRSRIISFGDGHSESEIDSRESADPWRSSPEIEVQKLGSNIVLVRIQCQKNISFFVNALTHMEKLGLSIISSSAMPFAKTNILITIVAKIEDAFCMTTKELTKNLQQAI